MFNTTGSIGLVAVLLLTPLCAGPAGAAPAHLAPQLLETLHAGSAPAAAARQVLRSRHVRLRPDLLVRDGGSPRVAVGERVGLPLFDDASFTATVSDVTRHGPFGVTVSARLDGSAAGHAVLAIVDGAMSGTVTLPGAIYRIGSAPGGSQVVEQIDPALFPRDTDPIAPADATVAVAADGANVSAATDPGSQIDVMVLYTAAARTAAGGASAMRAEAALAVASANQAYANNGLAQRLRLVYAGEIAITESGDIGADLNALRSHPVARWLRDASRADLVSLITSQGPSLSACGIAYVLADNSPAFAPYGFSVVDRACASANLTFAHELGHNMGAHHDPFVLAPGTNGAFAYSHGHVDVPGRLRTVMAYDDQCRVIGVSCTRVPYFSTPLQTINGHGLGTASVSDNSRTLAESAPTIANLRLALASPVSMSMSVNQPGFAGGQTLVMSSGFDIPGLAGSADLYMGVLLPDGGVVSFTPTVPDGYVFGSLDNPAALVPVVAGASLSSPQSASSSFSYQVSGSEPAGGYTLFLLLTRPGGLTAGLDGDQVLGVALAPFSFTR